MYYTLKAKEFLGFCIAGLIMNASFIIIYENADI